MAEGDGGEPEINIDPALLARAEAALETLRGDYPRWLNADLDKARRLLTQATPPDHAQLYTIIHDIKGQAATFGFPLVGDIAAALCEGLRSQAPPEAGRINAMLDAMARIVALGLSGDGGAMGRQILASLD